MNSPEDRGTPKFKVDENLPVQAAEALRHAGYDAVTVADQAMSGAPDNRLADVCRDEGRILVTLDLDFSNIQSYPPSSHPGIIVLRLSQQDTDHVLKALGAAIPCLAKEPLAGRLWVVDEHKIRIRA